MHVESDARLLTGGRTGRWIRDCENDGWSGNGMK